MPVAGVSLDPSLSDLKAVLEGRAATKTVPSDLKPGSVMILFGGAEARPELILTRRSEHVRQHRGEISFPGGKPESSDDSSLATALRESREELGISTDQIEVWGELEPVNTISTGYGLRVHVGALDNEAEFVPDPREVGEVLPVPMNVVLAPSSYRDETRIVDGEAVHRPSYSYNGEIVWGATARIIAQLITVLRPSS